MIACLNGNLKIAEYFVNNIPNLNWKNRNGQTALHAAVFSNSMDILSLLLNNKADITIKDIVILKYLFKNGLTPYHYAYIEKKADIIKLIHKILKVDNMDHLQ